MKRQSMKWDKIFANYEIYPKHIISKLYQEFVQCNWRKSYKKQQKNNKWLKSLELNILSIYLILQRGNESDQVMGNGPDDGCGVGVMYE